ncbi:MAG: amino acid permease [Francisellaceae bacterium]|nr:amino acid permease [Francisellaceae bacterium]MBT6538305.1 amino acid permease [Francisellaceae bacterium]
MILESKPNSKVLSVFSLVMINVIAVDSLRTLSFGAKLGTNLIFYYAICALFYFIPVGLITAELATTWPKRGGIYVWAKEAFGIKTGFLVVWLQWIYNVIWYPTILGLVVGIASYLIDPSLSQNKNFICLSVVSLFWIATILNLFGLKVSSIISTIGSIFGTLLPMFIIIGLGFTWIFGTKSSITWDIIPKINSLSDTTLMVTVMFGLVGLEMSAVHAQDVKNPSRDYPAALLISGVLILFTLVISSLMIALVVPAQELNIIIGIMQGLKIFFEYINMPQMLPVFGSCVILGALCSVSTWILGPAKGLLAVAADDHGLPSFFAKTNKYGAPVNILLLQSVIVTILSALYILLAEVETAYLLLTQLTAILALIMYIIMFSSAVWLRKKAPNKKRPFKIAGGKFGMAITAGSGITICLFAMLVSFLPPSQLYIENHAQYSTILVIGTIIFILPALFIKRKGK